MKAEPLFGVGDLLMRRREGQFIVFKVLRVVELADEVVTYHVMLYEPFNREPTVEEIGRQPVAVWHAPVANFTDVRCVGSTEVGIDELAGFRDFLSHTDPDGYRLETAAEAARHFVGVRKRFVERVCDVDEAIAGYSKAIVVCPFFSPPYHLRACLLMGLNRLQEAVIDLEQSVRLSPEEAGYRFTLGECLLQLGRYSDAQRQFAKVLELDPTDPLASDYLEDARERQLAKARP